MIQQVIDKLKTWHIESWDVFLLRVGLALTLLYAGISIFVAPLNWVGFVPEFIRVIYPAESFIIVHAVFDLLLGAGLLWGRYLWFFSGLAFFNLASILLFYGVDDITFRDIGLLFMALALFTRSISSVMRNKADSVITKTEETLA